MSQIVKQLQKALDYQLGLILWLDLHFNFRDQDVYNKIVDFLSSALQGLSTSEDMPIQQSRFTTSSSSSSHSTLVPSLPRNHNFLKSSREIDVPKSFEELLSSTVQQKLVMNLKDDGMLLQGASNITVSFLKPIRGTQILLIISSKPYVNSCRSLNELAYVMESKDVIDQIVTTFFNDIDPLDVRELRGELKKVFTTFKLNNDRVESWRREPKNVTYISDWPSNNMYRKKFVKKIIDTISHGLLPSSLISSANTGIIGIKSRMQDFKSQLQVGFDGCSHGWNMWHLG
ncbi:hypothetical protein L6452_13141 [Arctium lappa]|uniref:Uncharacterized protein n=1 Tax=Arctium lappa TaxID=4217 RepID=A0ACB9CHG8_ARCLA|nr:hypothetical protein L6452_13141 [Arctium lappa]